MGVFFQHVAGGMRIAVRFGENNGECRWRSVSTEDDGGSLGSLAILRRVDVVFFLFAFR